MYGKMGTNYYVIKKASREDKNKFKKMLNEEKYEDLSYELDLFVRRNKIHVGKSSCGWKFLFNSNNFTYFDKSADSVWKWLKKNEDDLFDEYGRHVTFDEFKELVESKQNGWDYMTYQINERVQDPYLSVSDYYIDDLRFSSYTDFS